MSIALDLFLFDRVVGKILGSGVVDTDRHRRLGVTKICKGGTDRDGFLAIHEGITNFGFSG